MNKQKQPHPDQHIFDGIWQEFIDWHNERPMHGIAAVLLCLTIPSLTILWLLHNSIHIMFASLATDLIFSFVFIFYIFPHCCKRVITRSPRRRKKYLEKIS